MLTLTSGERVLVLRKRAGYTQAQLASIVAANRLVINGIENGYRSLSFDLAERIALALRVPTSAITGDRFVGDLDRTSDQP